MGESEEVFAWKRRRQDMAEVRLAIRSSRHSLMRFSMSPRALDKDWKLNGQFTFKEYDYVYNEIYHFGSLKADQRTLNRNYNIADMLQRHLLSQCLAERKTHRRHVLQA